MTSSQPRWERPAQVGLLLTTAALYLWNLAASGWANSFYSAAVQAGTQSWKAFFFGSSDAANSITVDKPPASLWPMEIAARIFGVNSWSILVPEALMGVATVWLVYRTVRRHFSAQAALLAGATLALTPVAALMFKFNNPDAMLVLLLTAATALTIKAIETGRARWLLLAGVAVGFGFLTKQLQAFLVLPALVAVYAYAAPHTFGRRVRHLLGAFAAVLVSAGWWVAIVEMWPASSRPYIGGSQNNSFLELTFGYNGLGRLTGNETGSVTGGGPAGAGGGSMWGSTGLFRLFENEVGGQIAWLIPAALLLLALGLWLIGRAPRTDVRRATLLAFGGVMLTTALAFSFMAGIFHAYYTVALAPSVAVVVATGADLAWAQRDRLWVRIGLAATVLATAVWTWVLLDRAADWNAWLKPTVAAAAVLAAALIVLGSRTRIATAAAVVAAIVAVLIAPTAYSLQTVTTGHDGAIVTAGPVVAGGRGGFGQMRAMPGNLTLPRNLGGFTPPAGFTPPTGANGQMPGFPGGRTFGGGQGLPGGFGAERLGRGGAGGLLEAASVSDALKTALSENGTSYTWVAATVGSNSASGYQLATGFSVMPIGGFNGSDPSPTLATFKEYVAARKIHYFISGMRGGGFGQQNGGSNVSSQITAWVEATFAKKTIGGTTVYDLTSPTTSTAAAGA